MNTNSEAQKPAKGFMVACREYFGKHPESQTLQEFGAEVKALSLSDKQELAGLLSEALGEPVAAPSS